MTNGVNIREIILGILMEVTEDDVYCHIAIGQTLEKYQYLSKQDRSFITKAAGGTIEYMTRIDYIIEQFSTINVERMKPVIRNIMRSAVYQMFYMDRVPVSAICNEAVKLVQRRGFYNLKSFVNGVLRAIVRGKESIKFPKRDEDMKKYLSVHYSMPEWLVEKWLKQFHPDAVECMLQDFLKEKQTTVRCNLYQSTKEDALRSLKAQDIKVKQAPYLDYALYISGFNYLKAVKAFSQGMIYVQDVSSMLVGEIAAPKWGDHVIDVCASPGGKSLHIADKLRGSGYVEARDLTEAKAALIKENMERADLINMSTAVMDATVFHEDSVEKADIVIADVPCSGFGVIGKKPDIKYKITSIKQMDIITLQRKILHTIHKYVKVGGVLIYSTCTIGADENQKNVKWFLENYPYKLESIDPYLCEELRTNTTKNGYLQLLPGIHGTDGFFIARLKRVQ